MSTSLRHILSVFAAALPIVLAGCATYTHEYPNHSADAVWSAAVAVAESPDYEGDWHVTQNEVWVDDEWARIEIQREIRRLTNQAFTAATPEKRTWQFRVTLEDEDPVVLAFANRNPTIPGWTLEEAQRFFEEVNQLLIASPAAGIPQRQPEPEVRFDEPLPEDDADDINAEAEVIPDDTTDDKPAEETKKDAPPVDLLDEPQGRS